MRIWYFIAGFVLSLAWIVGFFFLGAGMIIHSVLMTGILFYLQSIISTGNLKNNRQEPEEMELV